MTTAALGNRFAKIEGPVTVYSCSASATLNPGDLAGWDTGNFIAKLLANAGDYANFLGVFLGQIPIASNIDNVTGLENTIEVQGQGIFNMNSTGGDTYTHGLSVKMGADNQTVTLDGGSNQVIGYVYLPQGGATGIVGGSGVLVPIRIKRNFPNQLP